MTPSPDLSGKSGTNTLTDLEGDTAFSKSTNHLPIQNGREDSKHFNSKLKKQTLSKSNMQKHATFFSMRMKNQGIIRVMERTILDWTSLSVSTPLSKPNHPQPSLAFDSFLQTHRRG